MSYSSKVLMTSHARGKIFSPKMETQFILCFNLNALCLVNDNTVYRLIIITLTFQVSAVIVSNWHCQ